MKITTISVEPLRPSERSRWAVLWSEYQLFYRVLIPDDVTETTWQRILTGRVSGLAAHDLNDHISGFAHYVFYEDTWSTLPTCYLQDLFVEAESRGTGCGRALIEEVARRANAIGASNVSWLTHEGNSVARKLYDRLAKYDGVIQYTYAGQKED